MPTKGPYNGAAFTLFNRSYVCPSCRKAIGSFEYTGSRRPLKKQHSTTPLFSSHKSFTRALHSTTSSSNLQESVTSTQDDIPPLESIIRKVRGLGVKNKPNKSTKSFIRDQLRAWSEQKVQNDKQAGLEDYSPDGLPVALPDSFFESDLEPAYDEFNDEFEQYEESIKGTTAARLVPGDLHILIMRSVPLQPAIYLGNVDQQSQFLLADGRWCVGWAALPKTIVLKQFASTEEVNSIREYLPKKPVTRVTALGIHEVITFTGAIPDDVSGPLVQRMRTLRDERTAFKHREGPILDNIYELLAHEDEYVNMSFVQVVQKLFNQNLHDLPKGAITAIHEALYRNVGNKILLLKAIPEEILVVTIPKKLSRQYEQVAEWAREYQECAARASQGMEYSTILKRNPLTLFVEKARRLILKSRQTRSPTTLGVLGPSSERSAVPGEVDLKDTGEVFSEEDKMIVDFIWDTFLRLPHTIQKTRYQSIGSMILRAVGAYPRLTLDRNIGRLLLQEIGALAPWNESSDESVVMPIPGRRGAHLADKLCAESEDVADKLGFGKDLSQIPMMDSFAHLRKDWGDMEVFCIDRSSTGILDDGISLEPAPDCPGAYWIHAHIANPTAFFDPDHIFGRRSCHFSSSVYTTRRQYPMLPFSVAETISLSPNKPVLTVSSLILPDGKVKEVRMTLGTVHNVIRLEPDAVNHVLGQRTAEQAAMILGPADFGPSEEVSQESIELARQYVEVLSTFEKLVEARTLYRQRQVPEFANWQGVQYDTRAYVSNLEPYETARLMQSYHYVGDPSIKLVCSRYHQPYLLGEQYKQEHVNNGLMLLAGESAGRWFRERQIPTVFNGTLTHPEYPISRLNRAPPGEVIPPPMSQLSSTPVPHVMLTISEYARVTSPLRRYADMIGHWQIGAYLKAEAEGQLRFDLTGKPLNLPFSSEDIDEYITTNRRTIHDMEHLKDRGMFHWANQAFFRAFHFNEAPLPEIWDFQVTAINPATDADDSKLRGFILPFRLKSALLKSKEGWEESCRFKQYIPVKLEQVDIVANEIKCRPVGPPSDSPTQSGPIRIVSSEAERTVVDGPSAAGGIEQIV